MGKRMVILAAALLLGAGLASPAQGAFIDCATFGICWGTDEADDITGTDGYDEIRGLEGGDDIRGGGSGDDIFGGEGRDSLKGNGGDDAIHGGPAGDEIRAAGDDSGGDFVDCGGGDDEAWANPGDFIDFDCEIVHFPD